MCGSPRKPPQRHAGQSESIVYALYLVTTANAVDGIQAVLLSMLAWNSITVTDQPNALVSVPI